MDFADPSRLSQIQTLWTVVARAQGDGPAEAVQEAQRQLWDCYGKVVYRYLLGALRDADAAKELTQEFALRFIRGDLQGADRQRGRFRDYLKGTLFHLIGDWHRRRQKAPAALPERHDPAAPQEMLESEEKFLESWRAELIDRAWTGLAQHEQETGQPFHHVLAFRAKNPEMRSEEMAKELSRELGSAVAATWVRQTLHRARERFAELLLEEIRQTLKEPAADEIEEELASIGLAAYCQPALARLRGKSADQAG
jgi:RNA polymerase sigma-70 factor (ECF subfamily)